MLSLITVGEEGAWEGHRLILVFGEDGRAEGGLHQQAGGIRPCWRGASVSSREGLVVCETLQEDCVVAIDL